MVKVTCKCYACDKEMVIELPYEVPEKEMVGWLCEDCAKEMEEEE